MPNRRTADARRTNPKQESCGIIRIAALCTLCRYRHKVHWAGHFSRCDRDLSGRFGEEAYAAEELVAELGAAFLCADLELTSEPRPDHAAYVASWLKVLRHDKRAIFTAAAKAQAAADWIHQQQDACSALESPYLVAA